MRKRLDLELVRRGLVATRAEAGEVIGAGRVLVAGYPAVKAETLVAASEPVELKEGGRTYASRGGDKLAAALDRFRIDPSQRICLDAGSSTGGFTDALVQRGAAHVMSVDVGYGQLAWHLRSDDRVTVLERTNVRDVRPEDLPARPNVITADLSFISLAKVIPSLVALGDEGADLVFLVKPQFEAARDEVEKGGVVRNVDVWRRVLGSVADACRSARAPVIASMASPLLGPAGNVEFFLHARVGAAISDVDIEEALQAAEALRGGKGEFS